MPASGLGAGLVETREDVYLSHSWGLVQFPRSYWGECSTHLLFLFHESQDPCSGADTREPPVVLGLYATPPSPALPIAKLTF